MKHILCVRLNNFPVNRLRRQWQRVQNAPRHDHASSHPVGARLVSPSFEGKTNSGDTSVAPTGNGPRRERGRPTTAPPRQRRWNHQLWYEGPRDQTQLPPTQNAADVHGMPVLARAKMLNIPRGVCMTPGVRASGPSYMKPVPPPISSGLGVSPEILKRKPGQDAQATAYPPLVLIRTVANRQIIVAASDEVISSGIRIGMTLTEAKSLFPNLTHENHNPARDAKSLEALARWMMRFTPVVSLPLTGTPGRGQGQYGGEGEAPPDGHAIYLDLTGCDRVFCGLHNIVAMVTDALSRMRLSATVAVAPTPGAAWAVASFGKSGSIVPEDQVRATLAPLPVAALRLGDQILQSLHHLGLETIDHVLKLPRNALPARFGPTLLQRIDQALGAVPEPLVPLRHFTPVEATMEFDGVVESLEAIWMVFKELLRSIVADLLKRGCGARQLAVEFRRAYTPKVVKTILLSRPSRNIVNLFDLLRCAMETLEVDIEFIGVTIRVPAFERISEEQTAYTEDDSAGKVELDHLVARLCARLGETAMVQPKLIDSHIPERAFTWQGFSTHADSSQKETRVENPCYEKIHRPLQLLPEPVEIAVTVSPSEDRDGRPIQFRDGRNMHRLTHAIGPERIAGEWWRGHRRTRDYFDVEDEAGKRFWVFRVNETHRWFLHGTFA
ncbi:MAG TPA: DNA polymerase Y family protein [Tepidisphaeraceae bacterium]|nr:DNA polymerase Y family protein [Tepidisphaeraceae bacterium]